LFLLVVVAFVAGVLAGMLVERSSQPAVRQPAGDSAACQDALARRQYAEQAEASATERAALNARAVARQNRDVAQADVTRFCGPGR